VGSIDTPTSANCPAGTEPEFDASSSQSAPHWTVCVPLILKATSSVAVPRPPVPVEVQFGAPNGVPRSLEGSEPAGSAMNQFQRGASAASEVPEDGYTV